MVQIGNSFSSASVRAEYQKKKHSSMYQKTLLVMFLLMSFSFLAPVSACFFGGCLYREEEVKNKEYLWL